MELILYDRYKYNIGIDIGDNLTNILYEKDSLLPYNKKISFIIPELDEEYTISIVIGNNILTEDNIIIHQIKLDNLNNKTIHINFIFDKYYIFINIESKIKNLFNFVLNYKDCNIPFVNKIIDMSYYKNKFEIKQIIKIIRKKINLNHIILDEESKQILEYKLTKILENIDVIDNITNQKMIEIKTTLKNRFFIG
jgi:D-ribose pyranose/furanose isomerase RbsD